MTLPRYVGRHQGHTTTMYDTATGARTTYTSAPRMPWGLRLVTSLLLVLGLVACALYPKAVAVAWATVGGFVILACLTHFVMRRLGLTVRARR